ncbi:MAG: hypothetical protein ACK52U_08990 [Synechococcaceae cyanobacterium]
MAVNHLVIDSLMRQVQRLKRLAIRSQARPSRPWPQTGGPRTTGLAVGVAVSAAAMFGGPADSRAALLRYVANGHGISGTLAGEAFSNALWQVSAEADPDHVVNVQIPPGSPKPIQAWLLKPVTPRLQLTWAGGQRTVQLDASAPYGWSLLSGLFPNGPSPKIGFVYANPDFTDEYAAGLVSLPPSAIPSLFNNLQQPVELTSHFGTFEAFTYPTNLDDLIITTAEIRPGTFQISPVPSPLPLLAVGGALGWSRQLRRRCRRTTPSRG